MPITKDRMLRKWEIDDALNASTEGENATVMPMFDTTTAVLFSTLEAV